MDGHVRSFLSDIAAHPHDDAPRLIFADWIEDHADALPPDVRDRGQLIRIQYALEDLSDDDPRRPMLHTRATALIAQHFADWTRPFDGPRYRPTFRRGFVEGLTLSVHADTPPPPGVRAPVRQVRLHGVDVSGFPAAPQPRRGRNRTWEQEMVEQVVAAAGWPLLAQLDELDLADLTVTSGWFTAADLGRVRSLAVRDAAVAAALAAPCLSGVTELSVFQAGTGLASASARPLSALTLTRPLRIDAVLERFAPGLRRLALRDAAPASVAAAAPFVEHLDLATSRVDASDLEADGPFPRLARLALNGCQFTDPTPGGGLSPAAFPALRSLNLRTTRPGVVGRLASSRLLAQLEALHVGYCGLRMDAVSGLLASLPAGLQVLDLSWNALGDPVAAAVAASAAASSLEMLDLSYCGMTPDAARALASLPDGARLVALNLGTNRITTPGLRALVASPALDRLEALDVSNGHLDESAADVLLGWPRFRELALVSVHGNDLSAPARDRLRAGFRGLLL